MPLERGNRTILWAVLASLALHFTLLLVLPSLREAQHRRNTADPIAARLVDYPRSTEETTLPTPATEPLKQEAPRLAESERMTPQPAPKRSKPKVAAEPEQARVAMSTAVLAAPTPVLAPPAAETLDAGTLAQYRLSLMSAARRFKSYPPVALDRNWQGNVEVRMTIGANGEIASLTIRSSAGHLALDQHALEMIERAKASALIPPALRGKQFVVDIPVEFVLREAG